jgi:sortase (surface protein transpeptidase)
MASVVVLVALAVSLLAGCGAGNVVADSHTPHASAIPQVRTSAAQATYSMPKSVPVSIRIPAIGASSSLVSLGLNPDRTVALPPVSTPMQASWFNGSPTPGQLGPSVIFGHVDGDKQLGIFFKLHELQPGDEIDVARQDGTTAKFAVTHLQEISKDQFPAQAVYGNTDDAELRLITCGGAFDAKDRNYLDNIIAYATLETPS